MIRIDRFCAADLLELDAQEAQADARALFADPAYGAAIEAGPYAFTVRAGDAVLGCGGLVIEWPGRGVCWAVVSRHAGPHFREIHRAVAGFMKQVPCRRIEVVVKADFAAGHRWAKLLGFMREGLMRAYSPAGDDYQLYARIRHD